MTAVGGFPPSPPQPITKHFLWIDTLSPALKTFFVWWPSLVASYFYCYHFNLLYQKKIVESESIRLTYCVGAFRHSKSLKQA
jgi:hypothetical protein